MGLTKAQKLAQTLEKKARAVEAKKTRKREELDREITAHMLWKGKIDVALREATLQVKLPVYRQEIEALRHTFDRTCDKKDSLIRHLIYLRDIASFQYQHTVGGFCVTIANIIDNFLKDLDDMCKQNEIKTAELLTLGKEEYDKFTEETKKAEQHLHVLLYTSHHTADNLAWNIHGENMVILDEEKSGFHEMRDTLRAILEGMYSALWVEYKTTIKSYVTKNSEQQKQLRIMRKKEQAMADIIAAQAKKLIKRESFIRFLRIEAMAYESGEKQAGFRDRRNRHHEAYKRMQKCMMRGVEIDNRLLNVLVRASDDAIESLEVAQKKCEKILHEVAQCRRYETQGEKVIPYGWKIPPKREKQHTKIGPSGDPMTYDAIFPKNGLAKLFYRISNAELSTKALIREKMLLQRENAILEQKLAEQNKENVVLNVNKCACSNPVPLKKYQTLPSAIEGSLEIKKYIR